MITTNALASKVAPVILQNLESRKDEIINNVHGVVKREAIKLAWDTLMNEVGTITEVAIDTVSQEFGKMNVNDLLAFLATKS